MSFSLDLPRQFLRRHPAMHFLARLSVKTKLALVFGCVMLTVLLALWLLLNNRLTVASQQQNEETGTLLVSQSAESITELVVTNDLLSLNVVLSQLVSPRSILYAAVYNVDRQLVAEAGDPAAAALPDAQTFSAPIDLQNAVAGMLEITLQSASWQEQERSLRLLFLGVAVAGLLFVLAAALAITSHLLSPLKRLQEALEQPLNAGPLPESVRRDEIRDTEEAGMQVLESYQELLRLENWREEAVQAWRKRHADVALLCLDVMDFENTLSILNPSTMTRLLNGYYRMLEQVAELYQGAFFRFTGQSVLLGFDRQQCANPEFNALCCGALFQHLVKRQNAGQPGQGAPILQFRALVNSGPALVTRTGLMDTSCLALIGDTVDTTLQLVSECPVAELTLTEEARREVAGEYSLAFRSLHFHTEGEDDADEAVRVDLQVLTTPLERITPLLAEQAEAILPADPQTP